MNALNILANKDLIHEYFPYLDTLEDVCALRRCCKELKRAIDENVPISGNPFDIKLIPWVDEKGRTRYHDNWTQIKEQGMGLGSVITREIGNHYFKHVYTSDFASYLPDHRLVVSRQKRLGDKFVKHGIEMRACVAEKSYPVHYTRYHHGNWIPCRIDLNLSITKSGTSTKNTWEIDRITWFQREYSFRIKEGKLESIVIMASPINTSKRITKSSEIKKIMKDIQQNWKPVFKTITYFFTF
jgi:hypothetical protein